MTKTVTKEYSDLFEKTNIFRSAVFKACQDVAGHRYDLLDQDQKSIKAAYKVLQESMEILERKIVYEKNKGF